MVIGHVRRVTLSCFAVVLFVEQSHIGNASFVVCYLNVCSLHNDDHDDDVMFMMMFTVMIMMMMLLALFVSTTSRASNYDNDSSSVLDEVLNSPYVRTSKKNVQMCVLGVLM